MSVHLRVLAMAGLVDSERTGRQIIYTAHAAIVEDVLASLAERLPTTPKPRRRLSIKASS
jgi:DNA-binding transcriptional ArsR family regulator